MLGNKNLQLSTVVSLDKGRVRAVRLGTRNKIPMRLGTRNKILGTRNKIPMRLGTRNKMQTEVLTDIIKI